MSFGLMLCLNIFELHLYFLEVLVKCLLELSFSIVLGAFINTLLFFVCF